MVRHKWRVARSPTARGACLWRAIRTDEECVSTSVRRYAFCRCPSNCWRRCGLLRRPWQAVNCRTDHGTYSDEQTQRRLSISKEPEKPRKNRTLGESLDSNRYLRWRSDRVPNSTVGTARSPTHLIGRLLLWRHRTTRPFAFHSTVLLVASSHSWSFSRVLPTCPPPRNKRSEHLRRDACIDSHAIP